MIIYHGSNVIVEQPKLLQSERMLDFGTGFYITSNKDQALRWAARVAERSGTKEQILSVYTFDFETAKQELSIIHFDEPNNEWLDFVCTNRSGRELTQQYDIALGPVADDNVFATVILYEQGLLNKEAAISSLKVQKLYNQILFHTQKSLDYCQYMEHISIGETSSGKR
jgi:hypothetical protein